jgi:tRNA(fMet)-specific endonuclease VapC
MLVLDTDVFTLVQYARSEEYARLVARLAGTNPDDVAVTVVSFEEQTRGWLAQVAKAKTAEKLSAAYVRLRNLLEHSCRRRVLDFDPAAAGRYQELQKAKLKVGTMDLRIAAIVMAHDALLLSRNLSHFRKVPGLRVEDWTTPPQE